MWIWFVIPLGVGLIGAMTVVARHSSSEGIYVGIIENDLAMGTGRDSLHVRAYVHEALVRELAAPSRLIVRMFMRENNTSVPLVFVRLPASPSPTTEREKRVELPVLPVIFRFDSALGLAVHPGQRVDVYIGER
jgi:HlyD family secretion protein